jgi:hypothetical protein
MNILKVSKKTQFSLLLSPFNYKKGKSNLSSVRGIPFRGQKGEWQPLNSNRVFSETLFRTNFI